MYSEHITETFHPLTFYLAGPMSGIPQFNYPEFHRIAKELREAGYNIISPVEEDSPELQATLMASKDGLVNGLQHVDTKAKVEGESWGDILARDVQTIFNRCDGVVVMQDWGKSRGARLEVFVANLAGRSLFVYEGKGRIRPMREGEYLQGITGASVVLGGSDYGRRKAV
jgi:hypothetical protein